MYILLLLIPALILFWLYLIHPSKKQQAKAEAFCKNSFAHRGLHGTVPENTLPTFRLACEAGVGIELDVRLTRDCEVVVFHDETLLRAAGRDVRISEMTYAELQEIRIFNSEETVPLFSDAVKEAGGVPLLVEIKGVFDCAELCEKTADILCGYRGATAVESFSPLALQWFSRNHPEFLRGQLSSRFKDEEAKNTPWYQRRIVENLLTNFLAKPDFIAYDVRHRNQISFLLCRKIFRPPVLFWTVKGGKKDGCIFED